MSMSSADTRDIQKAIQAAGIPNCVYCNSAMTVILKNMQCKDPYWIYECNDCRWQVAVALADTCSLDGGTPTAAKPSAPPQET